jgi:NADH-quinone oxidoreductase subunit J
MGRVAARRLDGETRIAARRSRGMSSMTVAAAFFYLFSGVTVASAFMVIASRNPVHSVLFLILAFVNAAGLFLLLGAEFLAMILVVVYVGAVAVLFLFVVMMLDVDFAQLRQGFLNYLPLGALLGVIFLIELVLVVTTLYVEPSAIKAGRPRLVADVLLTNTEAIGRVLYTQYIYYFQAAGFVLLVAMIGAIVLTLRHKVNVKRQDIAAQVARTPATGMEIKKVPFRQGVSS